VLGLALGMILALSQVASAAPAATTVDIALDGYCDGKQLNIPIFFTTRSTPTRPGWSTGRAAT
jgi:hypothetical protein